MDNPLVAKLEATLFVYGEPLSISKISKVTNESEAAIEKAAKLLEANLEQRERGLKLIKSGNCFQLVTKPEYSQFLEVLVKDDSSEELTPALLETLAVIAYCGPVSRAEIEAIRGVNASLALRRLELRGLVSKEKDYFTPTFDLIKSLGLANISQLPDFEKYQQLKNNGQLL